MPPWGRGAGGGFLERGPQEFEFTFPQLHGIPFTKSAEPSFTPAAVTRISQPSRFPLSVPVLSDLSLSLPLFEPTLGELHTATVGTCTVKIFGMFYFQMFVVDKCPFNMFPLKM